MHLRLCALALLLLSATAFSAHADPIPDGAFVRVDGTHFVVSGKPMAFVGANFDPMHGELNRARFKEVLHAMAQDGLLVGRVWALGEGPADAPEWSRKYELFRAGPDGFIEDSYLLLDRVLAAAQKEGIRLIITLGNHWKDYGGLPMYLRWAGLPQEGFAYEAFYRDERVRAFFRAGLLRLLLRTNSVTGVRYIDDPTIFSWELMNESSILTSEGQKAREEWIGLMARFIKERDKNHLVAPGLFGYAMRAERAEWVRIHRLKEVDYCDSHLYPQGQVTSWERLRDFLDDRAQLSAYVIGKPLVMGEFGFRTDEGPSWLGMPRASWYDRMLSRLWQNGAAGALAWIYEPYSGKPRDFGIYIDRPDTDDVRTALRHFARKQKDVLPALNNPRLSATRGDALLYEAAVTLYGPVHPHDEWQRVRGKEGGLLLQIPPEDFRRARFERVGVWKGEPVVHAYGADTGRFSYRFSGPSNGSAQARGQRPAAIRISARLSSEWPGASAPPDGGSAVQVLLDGAKVKSLLVIPDDGMGHVEEVTIDDPHAIDRLLSGTHTLTFAVPEGPSAHGLCIYGTYHAPEPAPAGEFGPIRIRYLSRPLGPHLLPTSRIISSESSAAQNTPTPPQKIR